MPASIDRVGRLNEWLVAKQLNQLIGNTAEARACDAEIAKFLPALTSREQRRATVASETAVVKIQERMKGRNLVSVTPTGEKNKKRGGPDYDVVLRFAGGTTTGYSLKLQTSPYGVNVRNPTVNSLLEYLTDTGFDARLSETEVREYAQLGEAYQKREIPSKQLGAWGAKKLAAWLTGAYQSDAANFAERLFRQLRADTNLILSIVDDDANFLGYVTKYPAPILQLLQDPAGLSFNADGISVRICVQEVQVGRIDVFMMSDSSGLGKKLRCVIRLDFEMDPAG